MLPWLVTLLAVTAAAAAAAAVPPPSSAVIFSAGFTDHAILQAAPASAALYGFALPSAPGLAPAITVTLALSATGAAVASVPALPADAGGGSPCDAACYSAGYLSGAGTTSCCGAPTCPIGCAIGGVSPSAAACVATCRSLTGCSVTVPNTSLSIDMCEGCLTGCPGKGECEAGCALRFSTGAAAAPVAWKALLPPQPPGAAEFTVTVACSNCAQGAAPSAQLRAIAFGSVFYCSGQSNMALGAQHSYAYEALVQEVRGGALDALRFFQFGGMGTQNAASAPVFATTALTYPAWPWQNLSAALAQPAGSFAALGSAPAACLYFLRALAQQGLPGPLGFISNAVGGTTLAAWADAGVLDACPNSTDTASAAPPTALFNGMAAPLFNTTLSGWVWYQGACVWVCFLQPRSAQPPPPHPRGPPFTRTHAHTHTHAILRRK
jgi:hypothetical protein